MKQQLLSLISWWLTAMTPIRGPLTTLDERETLRKRRLLSIVLGTTCLIIPTWVVLQSLVLGFTNFGSQLIIVPIHLGIIFYSIWLNRRGYLKTASLMFFSATGIASLIGAQTYASTSPLLPLGMCFLLTIYLPFLGLFIPPRMLLLLAVIESLFLFGYILIVSYAQMIAILSAQALQGMLITLGVLLYLSTQMGILYAVTTKKAVTQADRADELEVAYKTIQKQALTDALTGLPNHRAVMDQLQKELERSRRYGRPLSVLFFDADRFKHVNDTYGHAAGDAVLRQIGKRAASVLRGEDVLGRFGGEEFVILLSETDAAEASAVAERIRVAVATGAMALSEVVEGIAMSVSIGVATYPADGSSETELLAQADEAMYVAKRLGRNQVRTAEEARHMSADVELMTILLDEGQREIAAREGTTPDQLRETYTMRTICSLMVLLERRDEGLSTHAHAVSDLATMIAQAMDMEHKEVARIGIAALLHDIGKVAIPDMLLQKADHLSTRERTILREHAALGAQILEASPFLHDLRPAVRHHHERWDGNGYPDRLHGDDIPLAARIIAVAEAYDIMLAEQPYQARRSVEDALKEVRRGAGTQFDPAVVQALLMLLTPQLERHLSTQLVG